MVALILASLGLQLSPIWVAARMDRRAATEVSANVALADTLALPAQRADGQVTVTTRERSPVPLVAIGGISGPRPVSGTAAVTPPVTPHARSHAARLRSRTSDDPPLL